MSFATERELVHRAIEHLPIRRWLKIRGGAPIFQRTEVQGLFGVPDLLAVHARAAQAKGRKVVPSIAFEMKLSDWRRGLIQAFRYRSFATMSFVVLDNSHTKAAVANVDRFRRANIGLIGINIDGTFRIYVWPEREKPFSAHLHDALTRMVYDEQT